MNGCLPRDVYMTKRSYASFENKTQMDQPTVYGIIPFWPLDVFSLGEKEDNKQ